MASVQQTINSGLAHLRNLSIAQRLAVGLGGVLVIGSLLWMVQWAASPEMVPLLAEELSPSELTSVTAGLDAADEPYTLQGSRVFVRRSANRPKILAQLQQDSRLPSDTSVSFNQLVNESNPWISQEENNRRWTVALQEQLSKVLGQFAGVRKASVLLNLSQRSRGFSRNEPAASASVTLFMAGEAPVTRTLALAAARLVAGAVRGLKQQDVQVVDGSGRVALDWDGEGDGSAGALERQRREEEKRIAEKIRTQLPDPNARVNVQVVLDRTSRNRDASTPTRGEEIVFEKTEEQSQRGRNAGQPGVEPNVGIAANSGGVTETSTVNHERSEKTTGLERLVEQTPSGAISSVFAAVNISSSYLEGIFLRTAEADQKPTDADITRIFETEKAKIVNQVAALVKPSEASQVFVDWYYDSLGVGPGASAAAPALMSVETISGYAPVGALGLLALVSFGLMLRMARKSDGGEGFGLEIGLSKDAIDAARKAAEGIRDAESRQAASPHREQDVAAAIPTLGSAGGATPVLDAQEIDETTVQINTMLAEVQELVAADPEAVAGMVERWVDAPPVR